MFSYIQRYFKDFLIPIPLMELLQSVPDKIASYNLFIWLILMNCLRKMLFTSDYFHEERSTKSHYPSVVNFSIAFTPQITRSESSVITQSTRPKLYNFEIWLSDSQGEIIYSTFLVQRALIVKEIIFQLMFMHLDKYFLAYYQLPSAKKCSPFYLFSSLALFLLLIVFSLFFTYFPSKTQIGFILQQSRRSSIQKMYYRNLSFYIFWLSSKAYLQQALYSQGIISTATLLSLKVLMCYFLVIGSKNLSKPSIPMDSPLLIIIHRK